jgi:transcriptional regulator with XRE-family HTH domain
MDTQQQELTETTLSMDAIIGRRVHHLMWDRQLTQTSFGSRIGMHQSGLAKKLRGQRGWSADELVVVARELGVSVAYLFAEGDAPEPAQGPNGPLSDYSGDGSVIDIRTGRALAVA